MLAELSEKIRNGFIGQGYDIQSITPLTRDGIDGLLCSGGKKSLVEKSDFDLAKSKVKLALALQPHISAIESKYDVKLEIIFLKRLTMPLQFFIGRKN